MGNILIYNKTMDDKIKILFDMLSKTNDFLTSKELSRELECSDRTVRNYIKNINTFGDVILSSSKGYKLNKEFDLNKISLEPMINTSKNLRFSIIRKLFSSKSNIRILDIKNEFYISEKTLEKYIYDINNAIKDYNLIVKSKNGYLTIAGDENQKRRFLKDHLRINDYKFIENDLALLCSGCGCDYKEIKSILKQEFDKNNIFVNDYSFLNILTHIIVKIVRIDQCSRDESLTPVSIATSKEDECAKNILDKLKNVTNIEFSKNDTILLANLINSKVYKNELIIEDEQKECLEFVNETIFKIENHFGLSLKDDEFIRFFTFHVYSLLNRSKNEKFNTNPLMMEVINSDSFIYEIAVYVASRLKKKFNIEIPDEEVAFLAFHIGSIIIKKNLMEESLSIALKSYNFYNYYNIFKEDLISRLPKNTIIHDVESDLFLPSYTYDLLITSYINDDNINNVSYKKKITISPFANQNEVDEIIKVTELIKKEKSETKLQTYIKQFFGADKFETNVYFDTPEEYIEYMSNKLYKMKLVDDNFKNEVLEREHITPTSFENSIALPHSIVGNALMNCAYVIINEKPVNWGYYKVNIIVLIALNNEGIKDFKYLFDVLVDKISKKQTIDRICKCKDFSSFMSIILDEENSI